MNPQLRYAAAIRDGVLIKLPSASRVLTIQEANALLAQLPQAINDALIYQRKNGKDGAK